MKNDAVRGCFIRSTKRADEDQDLRLPAEESGSNPELTFYLDVTDDL